MILVTGATGTNGSELIKQLTAAGVPVRALVRNPAKAGAISGPNVELAQGDFTDAASLETALQGVDKAFLVPPFDERHVELTGAFVDAARRAGVQHIVKLSVIGAAPDSPLAMGRWHAASEKQIEDSGIAYTHLRPNSFMQNMLESAAQIKSEGTFYEPAEDARVSHVDVRDIAAVAAKALTESGHEGKTYEITGPEALSFGDIAAQLSDAIGKKVTYIPVSVEQFRQGLAEAGVPGWMVDALDELYAIYRAGYAAGVTNTVAEVTGRPAHSFAQFARDYAGAFKA